MPDEHPLSFDVIETTSQHAFDLVETVYRHGYGLEFKSEIDRMGDATGTGEDAGVFLAHVIGGLVGLAHRFMIEYEGRGGDVAAVLEARRQEAARELAEARAEEAGGA